jgi:CBS domain-containing protein
LGEGVIPAFRIRNRHDLFGPNAISGLLRYALKKLGMEHTGRTRAVLQCHRSRELSEGLNLSGQDMTEVLMYVHNIMSRFPTYCTEVDPIEKAARVMKEYGVGAVPVVTDHNRRTLVGIVTDRDLCIRVLAERPPFINARVSDVMTRKPVTCKADDPLEECELKMRNHQVRRIPIVDEQGALVGIVSQADVLIHDNAEHSYSLLGGISRPCRPLTDDDLDD